MSAVDRLYALVLHAYPASFRRERGEEILGTLADTVDAGESPRHLRQVASLLRDGNRQRWLRATNGVLASTVRQGLAWGVLVLVARQAGLAVFDLVHPFVRHWEPAFSVTYLLLALGWTVAFCLLAAGRRCWGLIALGAVLAGLVFDSVRLALSYGGPFSWPFTLHFFLPIALPLLAACAWPRGDSRLPRWSWLLFMTWAAAAAPITLIMSPGSSSGALKALVLVVGICAGLVVLILSLCDPRWAVAASLVLSVFGGQGLVSCLSGWAPVDTWLKLLALWIVVPAGATILARRARPRVRA